MSCTQQDSTRARSKPSSMKRALVVAFALAAALVGGMPGARASEPESHKIELPSTPGTLTYTWTGTAPPGVTGAKSYADESPCLGEQDVDTDIHTLELSLAHARVYKEANISFLFKVEWDEDVNDMIINLVGPAGGSLGYGDSPGATTSESIKVNNLDEGPYELWMCSWAAPLPVDYKGTLEITVTKKATAPAKVKPTAGGAGGSTGSSDPSVLPMSPAAPAMTSPPRRPAVGAGRISSTASPIATIPLSESAPSAFRGGNAADAALDRGTVTGALDRKTGEVANLPIWLAFVVIVAALAAGAFGLLARRRRGLDATPGTAAVPVVGV